MYAQADLRLCWPHIPHCWKSHVAAQMVLWRDKKYVRFDVLLDNKENQSGIMKYKGGKVLAIKVFIQ